MKRVNVDVEDQKRAKFKSKAAAEGFTMTEVLSSAIDDYLSGKWKPTRRPALKRPAK